MAGDYSVDTVPSFPSELKGNSAEGNYVEGPMKGYGLHAAFERPDHSNTTDALGAFIQGGNSGNTVAAGKPMSDNESFNPTEK
jgi:hypothetical protein